MYVAKIHASVTRTSAISAITYASNLNMRAFWRMVQSQGRGRKVSLPSLGLPLMEFVDDGSNDADGLTKRCFLIVHMQLPATLGIPAIPTSSAACIDRRKLHKGS